MDQRETESKRDGEMVRETILTVRAIVDNIGPKTQEMRAGDDAPNSGIVLHRSLPRGHTPPCHVAVPDDSDAEFTKCHRNGCSIRYHVARALCHSDTLVP